LLSRKRPFFWNRPVHVLTLDGKGARCSAMRSLTRVQFAL
jgi:hypothetical protein